MFTVWCRTGRRSPDALRHGTDHLPPGVLCFHLRRRRYGYGRESPQLQYQEISKWCDCIPVQIWMDYHSTLFFIGVFFLFGQGRLKLCRSQPKEALDYYKRAMEVQNQYRNLHHISFWEMAVANLALWDISASLDCWRTLHAEATVSVLGLLWIWTSCG